MISILFQQLTTKLNEIMRIATIILLLFLNADIGFGQFTRLDNPEEDFHLGAFPVVESHNKLFTITGKVAGFDNDGIKIYVSEDAGLTWSALEPENGFNNRNIEPRAFFGNDSLLIFSARRQVIVSKDGGLNWESWADIASTADEDRGSVFAVIDDVILAGTADDTNNGGTGIYRKQGDGDWELITEGLDNDEPNGSPNIIQITENKGRLLVSASDGFYISDDKGLTFTRTVVNSANLEFAVHGDTIAVNGTKGGRRDFSFMVSYDNGSTFEEIIAEEVMPSTIIYKAALEDIAWDGEHFLMSMSSRNDSLDGGLWKSKNLTDWDQVGLGGVSVNHILVGDDKVFASAATASFDQRGLYYISKEDVVTTDSEYEFSVPKALMLKQNYPNPFNPSTNITFTLNTSGEVTLEVYNAIGRKVESIITGTRLSAGEHNYTFNAEGLSSGLYYYVIRMGNQTTSKQMMLIK